MDETLITTRSNGAHRGPIDRDEFARACRSVTDWPLPGDGRTARRFALLAAVAHEDLVVARLVEAHADAIAIISELCQNSGQLPGETGEGAWGVWAAGPASSLQAVRAGASWLLTGAKPWCSGAGLVTNALIDAVSVYGQQLFAIDTAHPGVELGPPRWAGFGMTRSDTRDVSFSDVPAWPVGAPGSYLDRPGFWAGAMGVAACWHGGTVGVADTLTTAAKTTEDPHLLAHLGAVHAALAQNRAMLWDASRIVDEDPKTGHPVTARALRSTVRRNAADVIDRVARAVGPRPLAFDSRHADLVADLSVYVCQEHAERDLEQLGRDVGCREREWIV